MANTSKFKGNSHAKYDAKKMHYGQTMALPWKLHQILKAIFMCQNDAQKNALWPNKLWPSHGNYIKFEGMPNIPLMVIRYEHLVFSNNRP
jgi:hypothetical protein